jgi:hypothetical protein
MQFVFEKKNGPPGAIRKSFLVLFSKKNCFLFVHLVGSRPRCVTGACLAQKMLSF